VEQRKQAHGCGGHFIGPRVNCESLPCLPAKAVEWVLRDPRQLAYLMVWKNEESDEVIVAARVAAYSGPAEFGQDFAGYVEIRRPDGTHNCIRTIERHMPRNGGKTQLLVCPRCQRPRRTLYPWALNPARPRAVFRASTWQCRSCARLRYASEGGALMFHPRTDLGRLIEAVEGPSRSPRPEPWYPYVFADPRDADEILPLRSRKIGTVFATLSYS